MSGSSSSSNDLSKSSTNLHAHKTSSAASSPSLSPSASLNGSPSSPTSPLSQSLNNITPTSSPTTSSPLGGATASPRDNITNNKKSSGGIEERIIIHYGEQYERKIEVKLTGGQSDFTLKDFLLACEYDSGCLRSVVDPSVTIMADNFVVPAGEYKLHKSSRSGSFLSSRLKHLSIPVNQLMRLAEVQKAMNTESGTAFKFPLSIQDEPKLDAPSSPLSGLARKPTNLIPAPIARTPPPSRRPRTSFPPHLLTSPSQSQLTRSPSSDSQDSNSDSSPPTTPTGKTSPRVAPTPPSRASRTYLALSQPTLTLDGDGSEEGELISGELHNSDNASTLYKNSYAARRRIAPARQNEVAEVQYQLRQQNIVGGRVTGRAPVNTDEPKIIASPSMNSLGAAKGSPTTNSSTAPKLRRVQTQPSLKGDDEEDARVIISNTSRPSSPPNASSTISPPHNPNQRIIKGSSTNIARPPPLSKFERVMGPMEKIEDKDKKDKDKDKKDKEKKDKEKKDKKEKEKEEKKDKKDKDKKK